MKNYTFNKNYSTNQAERFPKELESKIVGLILGDASLFRSSPTSNVRLEMSFGSNYKEYGQYISNLFKDYSNNPL